MLDVCLNSKCKEKENLLTAPSAVKEYYDVQPNLRGLKFRVCKSCFGNYEEHLKAMELKMKCFVPVMSSLVRNPDSLSDDEEKSELVSAVEVMEVDDSEDDVSLEIDDDLDEIIKSTLDKMNFHYQIDESISFFKDELEDLRNERAEINGTFNQVKDSVLRLKNVLEQAQGLHSEELDIEFVDSGNTGSNVKTWLGSNSKSILASSLSSKSAKSFPPYSSNQTTGIKASEAAWMKLGNSRSQDLSQEVIPVGRVSVKRPELPPIGEVQRKELKVGMRVYAMKASYFGIWYKAKLIELKVYPSGEKQYKVRYETKKMSNQTRMLSAKHLAYLEPAEVTLKVGTRIIAQYKDEYWYQNNSLYAGIIAEPPKKMNNYRYLVFFDDGYAQYINHDQIHVVCEVSKEVWDDIHPDSKEFIRSYLQQYPERPMVKLQKHQIVKTEWNGKWWIARVLEVDASLVKMYFDADKRTEWIYRGSTRLGPLYNELANAEANKVSGKLKRHNLDAPKKKNAPYVEYTRGLDEPLQEDEEEEEEEEEVLEDSSDIPAERKQQVAKKHTAPRPNVAKKSTSQPQMKKDPPYFNLKPGIKVENDGTYVTKYSQRTDNRVKYVPHTCSYKCILKYPDDPVIFKDKNNLLIPMLYSWERQISKYQSTGKRAVFYRTPCGIRLRSIEEIHYYLVATNSHLTVDLFCFDTYVHCFGEFEPTQQFCFIKDIAYGKENVPVTCVNSINRQYPEYVEYSTQRLPAKGVNLNLDPEFLIGCDCEDDCQDPSKCVCQQLTSHASHSSGDSENPPGYYYRRLKEQVVNGIYECNSRCKCRQQCLNRVVQNGLSLRLQVFKTEHRGWGLRCLDDIPHGGFICIYAGLLLTDEGANEDGTQYGDEYLAELDHIEVVEKQKEGYESDVVDPEDQSQDNQEKQGDSDECGENDSEEDDGHRSDSSTGPGLGDNSSDSDFQADVRVPILPRAKSSRNRTKSQKIHLRRSSNNSQQSWSAQSSVDQKSIDGTGNNTGGEEGIEDETNVPEDQELPDLEENSSDYYKMKFNNPRPLSPSTLEQLKDIKLTRRPRVSKRTITCDTLSDSEEESNRLERSSVERSSSIDASDQDGDGDQSDLKPTRQPSRFCALPDPKKPDTQPVKFHKNKGTDEKPVRKSVRSFFGEEYCYIMDAKSIGNIGRYLNHSCTPNVFVQNVFVDTHDLRFPWVAFFAMQYIRAGTELTWDYNYDVGSVPEKVMYCYCGSSECRGRLL